MFGETYHEEYGEWIKASHLAFWYGKDVHGLDQRIISYDGHDTVPILDYPQPDDGGELSPFMRPGASLGNTLVRMLKSLREFAHGHRLSNEGRGKLVHGIQCIEEVLPELLGIKEVREG